jgi:S-formylglutathione hydrolase FrmB
MPKFICKTTAMIASCFVLIFLLPLFSQNRDVRVQDIRYDSAALGRPTDFSVVLPAEPPPSGGYPVLIILHGLGRNHHTLLEDNETLALLKAQHYLIVLPDSRKGWWIDSPISGDKYDSMLLEVIDEVKHRYSVNHSPSEWGVVGWSMGGFGTMHFAEHHPDLVSFVGTVIGLLDFPRTEGLPKDQRFPVDEKVFGTEATEWQKLNPSDHTARLKGKELVIVIGEQSFDRTMNENFLRRARAAGLKPEVHRIEGAHVFCTVVHGLQILLPRAEMHFRRAERLAKR